MSFDEFWGFLSTASSIIGVVIGIVQIFVIRYYFAKIFQHSILEKLFKISYVLFYGVVACTAFISGKIYSTRCVLPNNCSGSDVLGEAIFVMFFLLLLVGFFLTSWMYFFSIPSTKFLRENSDFSDEAIQSWKRWKIAILILTIAMPILYYFGFAFIANALTPVSTTPEA